MLSEALDAVLQDGVRGNRFARAGVETAAWDLEAHRRGVGRQHALDDEVAQVRDVVETVLAYLDTQAGV